MSFVFHARCCMHLFCSTQGCEVASCLARKGGVLHHTGIIALEESQTGVQRSNRSHKAVKEAV